MTELIENAVLTGEKNYEAALNQLIQKAERELLIFDQDFGKGGYASLKRFELIRDFLAKDRQNRLVIVLQDAGYFTTQCPRLFQLLVTYSHVMTVYQANDNAKVAKDNFVIADQRHYLRRFHIDQARFKYAFDDIEAVNMLNMRFDELLQETSHTISITALGL
ncbi:MAG: DUF7931 domain-containing protein [Methylophilaceae bacterium]